VNEALPSAAPGPGELFVRFTQVGVSGFGGVMPFARRMLVEERRWLNAEEFTDVLSLCQLLPGPTSSTSPCASGRAFTASGERSPHSPD